MLGSILSLRECFMYVVSKSMRVLVTGGAGFIGSHVVDRLVRGGFDVRVLDNLSTGSIANIQGHLDSGSIDFVEGDILDSSLAKKCLENVDVVVHLAALISVPLSLQNPQLTFDINVGGTLNLLRNSVEAKIKRFIFISSCAVYGDPKTLPVTEEAPTNPISPYAESKLLAERYCLGFGQRRHFQTVILRFFNVYGQRQRVNDYSGVITRFSECLRKGVPLTVYGDGAQTRDFVNVADVAEAVLACIQNRLVVNETLNIGSGIATSINELANALIEVSGCKGRIIYCPKRAGDIQDSYADISKANRMLSFTPKVSLKNGLESILNSKLR
jgi:UDP-glucose 4-epimerase